MEKIEIIIVTILFWMSQSAKVRIDTGYEGLNF